VQSQRRLAQVAFSGYGYRCYNMVSCAGDTPAEQGGISLPATGPFLFLRLYRVSFRVTGRRNGPETKQYSRNLGKANGIELIRR